MGRCYTQISTLLFIFFLYVLAFSVFDSNFSTGNSIVKTVHWHKGSGSLR